MSDKIKNEQELTARCYEIMAVRGVDYRTALQEIRKGRDEHGK